MLSSPAEWEEDVDKDETNDVAHNATRVTIINSQAVSDNEETEDGSRRHYWPPLFPSQKQIIFHADNSAKLYTGSLGHHQPAHNYEIAIVSRRRHR